jgi:hypothetical protein
LTKLGTARLFSIGLIFLFGGCNSGVISLGAAEIHAQNPEGTSFSQLSQQQPRSPDQPPTHAPSDAGVSDSSSEADQQPGAGGGEFGDSGTGSGGSASDGGEGKDGSNGGGGNGGGSNGGGSNGGGSNGGGSNGGGSNGEGSGGSSTVWLPPVSVGVDINTVSRCHVGDLDNGSPDFWIAYGSSPAFPGGGFNWPGGNNPFSSVKYVVSVEGRNGELLGSMSLSIRDLVSATQQHRPGMVHRFHRTMQITVPISLVKKGAFDANMMVCVDANGDGRCSDENVVPVKDNQNFWGKLGGGFNGNGVSTLNRSRLISVVGLKATIVAGHLTFKRAPGSAGSSDPWKDATGFAQNLLNNIHAQQGTGGSALFASLAVRTGPNACQFASRSDGCFVAGTRIAVGEGRTMVVEDLGKGATIQTADGKLARSLRAVAGPETEKVLTLVTTSGHSVTVTRKHPIKTSDGIKLAQELKLGDTLYTVSGPTILGAIRKSSYAGLVYNFALPGGALNNHLVVANGLVVGDLYLQKKLSRR